MNHHRRSAQVWRVLSRDLTVLPAHPHVHPQSEWAIPALAFPDIAGTHLPTPEGWKAEQTLVRSSPSYLSYVSCGQPRLPSQESGVSALPNFGVLLYLCLQFLTQNDQIRHGNTTMRRGVFLGQRRHCIYTLMCRAVCLRQWNFVLSPPWLAAFSFSLCLASVCLSVCLISQKL